MNSANSSGSIFLNILDLSVFHNSEFCTNYLDADKCPGRMYPTEEKDYNKFYPNTVFLKLKCEICGYEKWSEPKIKN